MKNMNKPVRTHMRPINNFDEALAMAKKTYNDKILPLGLILDASYSMNATFKDGVTRWQATVDNCVELIRHLQREALALVTRLTLVVFNSGHEVILENEIVAEIDTAELGRRLGKIEPDGVTMLGKTFCATLNLMERHRQELRSNNVARYMPIVGIFTDGLPTNAEGSVSGNTLSQAYHLADTMIGENRLTVIPFGIASEGDDPESFKFLKRLAGRQITDGAACPVVTTPEQMRKAFRYLGQTLSKVSRNLDDIHKHTCEVLGITMTQGV